MRGRAPRPTVRLCIVDSGEVLAAVPQGRSPAIRGYAAAVVGCSPDRIAAVSRFEDGNRHEVYKVSYVDAGGADADLVVRVSFGDDPAERAQAEREARVLEKVGGVAGPHLYDCSVTSRWFETPALSMAFVPGRQLVLGDATSAEIEKLGSVVAWVHAQPVDDLAEVLSETSDVASYAAGRMRSILAGLPWVREPLAAPIRERLAHAARGVEQSWEDWRDGGSFDTGEKVALIHGDIAFGNVLWGPEPVLIDWEFARLGDPADDIAYLFDQNELTATQRSAFWRGYRACRSNDAHLAHVVDRATWWEPLTLLGSALWWVERWVRRTEGDATGTIDRAVSRDPGYYYDHVIRRLDRLDGLMRRP